MTSLLNGLRIVAELDEQKTKQHTVSSNVFRTNMIFFSQTEQTLTLETFIEKWFCVSPLKFLFFCTNDYAHILSHGSHDNPSTLSLPPPPLPPIETPLAGGISYEL